MTFPVSYLDIPSSANFPYNYKDGQRNSRGGQRLRKNVDYTEYAEGLNAEANEMIRVYGEKADKVFENVNARLK